MLPQETDVHIIGTTEKKKVVPLKKKKIKYCSTLYFHQFFSNLKK